MTEIKPVPELEELKKQWYNTDAVAFEMINAMKYRESVFIATNKKVTQRMLKINAVRFLYMNFDRYRFFEQECLYNIYNSVAHFPELPMGSFRYEEKREQQAKFNANYMEFIKGYDLFIDLDNPNFQLVYSSAKLLKEIFDSHDVRYSVIYSGTKGLHFTVEYQNLPNELKQLSFDKLAKLFKLFAYELKLIKKIKDIDTSVFDLRRIKKVPYSVVYPYYRVALPLTDEQFENFNISDVFLPNLEPEQMKRRGLLTRQGTTDGLMVLMKEIAIERKKSEQLFRLCKTKKQTLYGLMKEMELI